VFLPSRKPLPRRRSTCVGKQTRTRPRGMSAEPKPLERLRLSQTARPLDVIQHWRDAGYLDLSPPYQRGNVWGIVRQQNLIRSILIGVPGATVARFQRTLPVTRLSATTWLFSETWQLPKCRLAMTGRFCSGTTGSLSPRNSLNVISRSTNESPGTFSDSRAHRMS